MAFPASLREMVFAPPSSRTLPRPSAAVRGCSLPVSPRPPPKRETSSSRRVRACSVGTAAIAPVDAAADGDTSLLAGFAKLMEQHMLDRDLIVSDTDLPPPHQMTAATFKSAMGTNTNLLNCSHCFPICGACQATLTARGPHVRRRCWAVRCLKNNDDAAAAAEPERDEEKATTVFTTVVKFEGSSLASAKRMTKVADRVISLTKDSKEKPIIFLSAMGNTTNDLIQAGEKAVSFAFSSVSEIQEVSDIIDLHLRTIDELGLDSSIILDLFDELEQLLKGIATTKVLALKAREDLVSIGERMSTTVFAAYLNKLGKIKARKYYAFDMGFKTPKDLLGANTLELTCAAVVKRLQEDWSVEHAVPIISGSLGKGWKSCARGGNDFIAATIAKALGLSEIQVWKDVHVLLTCELNKYSTSGLEGDLQIIENGDLEELKELDSGTFGTVYYAKWNGTDVAVKFLKKSCFTDTDKPSMQKKLERGFWQETKILSKLRHPNVLPFYGVVVNGPGGTLGTVTEFIADGSLRHVLQHKAKYLDDHKRIIIAKDAALGMEYMHSRNIVHFDLKSGNLLVNIKDKTRPICKVGDFGLSKIKKNAVVSGFGRGTVRWMAPELMDASRSKEVSDKVDVYSFGIVMWEILTEEVPYNNLFDNDLIILGVMNNTLRPLVPANCDPEWKMLMEQCWDHDPRQRPDFREIALRLQAMSTAANYSEMGAI